MKNKETICEITFIDKQKISDVKKKMKSEIIMYRLSEIFKVLGDTTRVKIISALLAQEFCVCEISELLGTTKSAVSHQLRILRNMRLVKYRKDGKMAFYSLDDNHITNLFAEGLRHVEEK
ncbi:MAG: winged helix-turn-helix transcriptional regulator [Actinobacteria bacterium]|nr:winged helix-turn-helix transcriptional regulator [Actinomycetota bacterium]MBL7123809.1 winged helix-turn-helix transcriptional regulator [Actinomycetota bacterium]